MIHLPMAAQIAKTEIARRDAEEGRVPVPGGGHERAGPVVRARRAVGRLLVALGSRLDDTLRPVPVGDPCR